MNSQWYLKAMPLNNAQMKCVAPMCACMSSYCVKTLFLSSSPLSTLSRNLRLNERKKYLIHRREREALVYIVNGTKKIEFVKDQYLTTHSMHTHRQLSAWSIYYNIANYYLVFVFVFVFIAIHMNVSVYVLYCKLESIESKTRLWFLKLRS